MIKRYARKVDMKSMSRWRKDKWEVMFYGGKVYDVEVTDRKYSVVDELGERQTYGNFDFFLYFHDVEETRDIIIKDILKDGEC